MPSWIASALPLLPEDLEITVAPRLAAISAVLSCEWSSITTIFTLISDSDEYWSASRFVISPIVLASFLAGIITVMVASLAKRMNRECCSVEIDVTFSGVVVLFLSTAETQKFTSYFANGCS